MIMEFDWIAASVLLSVRFAAATALTPIFGPTHLPGSIRTLLSLVFGAAVAMALPSTVVHSVGSLSTIQWGLAAIRELMIGAVFSLGFLSAYAATQVAGRTLDVQIGFGVAGILNPATSTFSPLLGSLYGMIGIAVFLAMDGHHQLLRALTLSVQIAQPGTFGQGIGVADAVQQSSVMFAYGLMLAAPIMLSLLLVDLTLAVYARSLPQLNILVLSFAIKVVIGMALLAVSLEWTQWTFTRLYQTTFEHWFQAVTP